MSIQYYLTFRSRPVLLRCRNREENVDESVEKSSTYLNSSYVQENRFSAYQELEQFDNNENYDLYTSLEQNPNNKGYMWLLRRKSVFKNIYFAKFRIQLLERQLCKIFKKNLTLTRTNEHGGIICSVIMLKKNSSPLFALNHQIALFAFLIFSFFFLLWFFFLFCVVLCLFFVLFIFFVESEFNDSVMI